MTAPADLIARYDQEQAGAKAELAGMVEVHRRLVAELGPMEASTATFHAIARFPEITQTALAMMAIAALAERDDVPALAASMADPVPASRIVMTPWSER